MNPDWWIFVKLSLIFPVLGHRKTLLERAQDLSSFWVRFPIDVEVIFVTDPASEIIGPEIEDELQTLIKNSSVTFQVLTNPKKRGRGASVMRGLNEASGEVLSVNSIDLAIPLAEVFSGLQEFIMHRDQSFLLLGNRRGLKKKRKPTKQGLRSFFEGVEHEKAGQLGVSDPTCPFFMIKKSDWQRLEISKLRRWFYTPAVLQAARMKTLEVREIEIQSNDHAASSFRLLDGFL